MDELWATTTLTDSITGTILDVWIVWSSNPMKNSKVRLKRKSAGILRRVRAKRAPPIRVGVELMDSFFSRMKDNARKLDRGRAVEPVTLSALALALARDPSAVRRALRYRINRFCVVAFLTAASGIPVSKVTSLPPRLTARASRYMSVSCRGPCIRVESTTAESNRLTSSDQNSWIS
jgi:hypothetical protein